MAKREWGSERRGEDDDEGNAGLTTRKVEIENRYFDKLNERLTIRPRAIIDPETTAEEPKGPGIIIYGSDGHPIK